MSVHPFPSTGAGPNPEQASPAAGRDGVELVLVASLGVMLALQIAVGFWF